MKTRQGLRDLNLVGPRPRTTPRVPAPGESRREAYFCAHTAMNVWDAAVNKVIGTKCSKCNIDLSGKAGDL